MMRPKQKFPSLIGEIKINLFACSVFISTFYFNLLCVFSGVLGWSWEIILIEAREKNESLEDDKLYEAPGPSVRPFSFVALLVLSVRSIHLVAIITRTAAKKTPSSRAWCITRVPLKGNEFRGNMNKQPSHLALRQYMTKERNHHLFSKGKALCCKLHIEASLATLSLLHLDSIISEFSHFRSISFCLFPINILILPFNLPAKLFIEKYGCLCFNQAFHMITLE